MAKDRTKWVINMKYWIKYATAIAGGTIAGAAYYLPSETFLTFILGWLFLIPAGAAIFLVIGLRKYLEDRKHRITVSVKPNEAMKALARREKELKKEKERLYKEMEKEV